MEYENVTYTKEQVLASVELKDILFKRLKKALLNERSKMYSRQYRLDKRVKINEYQKQKTYDRYHHNPEWRAQHLEKGRIYRYNKKLMEIPSEPVKRGPKPKMILDENLELRSLTVNLNI